MLVESQEPGERMKGVSPSERGLTLHTRTPAPAATIAAVVETLNVSFPSPPVPTRSAQP